MISLSAITIDGSSVLATPVTDSFQLFVPQVITGTNGNDALSGGAGTQLIFGLDGDDVLVGGAGNDRLVGGPGADTLTGGDGSDIFAYMAGGLGAGVDTITDFAAGLGGDAIDISALLTGFDPSNSILTEFIQITTAGLDSIVRIDPDGGGDSFVDLAVLQGVAGLDVNTMHVNGNLIV